MIIPFIPHELFEVNPNYTITSFDGEVLIIDNWYKNYTEIKNVLYNTPAPRWKWTPTSRNFIDYYDCRPVLLDELNMGSSNGSVQELCNNIFSHYKQQSMLFLNTELHTFNFFKAIKPNISNNLQHFPHRDTNTFTCIVYLDEICSGGTALYYSDTFKRNEEQESLLVDVSGLNTRIVKAVPNRLIIFRGDTLHGAYIDDYEKYQDNWRMTEVYFISPDNWKI
jgi:hypothetical protein